MHGPGSSFRPRIGGIVACGRLRPFGQSRLRRCGRDGLADAGAQGKKPGEVAERLQSIRLSVSDALQQYAKDGEPFVAVDPEQQLAWWGNGWRNGGWHNGGWGNGWHNGGWGNGWHNGGWGNGWHNW